MTLSRSNEIVTDAEVEKALDWLRDNSDAIGEAKRASVKYDKMLHHAKAIAMKSFPELSVTAQEREAYAHAIYKEAIENAANTAGEYEKMKALREAAALKIEVWRSASANYRAMKI